MSAAAPEQLAGSLTEQAGLGAPREIEALAGGRNNRVFRVTLGDGKAVVLKCYHHDPRDPRDRLQAEWRFLGYVGARGVRNVPQPLACEPSQHTALYAFVQGRRAAAVDADLTGQAADFAIAINGAPRQPQDLAPASEACFSLASHIDTVNRRVARLTDFDDAVPHVADARAFVETRLNSAWRRVHDTILREAKARGVAPDAPIAREMVSPSDFGFHNALIDEQGRASFLDFEYAGRDDPAKLICDFFCQPELAVPLDHYDAFTGKVAAALDLSDDDLWRARVLLDAYRVKWVCIMLNEFSPIGARRRAFASAQDLEIRAARQLRTAQSYLDLVAS